MNHLAEYYSDDESPFRRNSEEEPGIDKNDKGKSFRRCSGYNFAYFN